SIMSVDPQTLLPTAGVVEGFSPEACAPFWDHELLVPGFNKFNVLARSNDPVATLIDATDGDLGRAPIYDSVYAPMGVADEPRARASRTSTHFATRVRGSSGRWLRLTAAPMAGDDGTVAVMIEPARAADLTPILLESYGLTKREGDIVLMLARGLSTKQIATE